MPTVDIPLFTKTFKGVDKTVLTDESFRQYNAYTDELGGVNVRPGESLGINSGVQVDGLYFWPGKYLLSVEAQKVKLHQVNSNGTLTLIATSLASSEIPVGASVTFTNDATYTFLAARKKICYVDSSGNLNVLADADAPTQVSHVVRLDGYILANNLGDGKVYWSDVNSPLAWSALSFAEAEGNPDNNVAIALLQRQLYLIGEVSTEIWENDGSTPFSRIPGGYIEQGCVAPYSVVKLDNSLIWLGHNRYFVEFSGRDVRRISTEYDEDIADFSQVSDCVGKRVEVKGRTYCLFNFPAEGRTLCYDVEKKDWSEWGEWDEISMTWLTYDFTDSVYGLSNGKSYVAKARGKQIAYLDKDSRVDLTSSGTAPVKYWRLTGSVDFATSKRKRIEEVRFRVRRGKGLSSRTPKLMFRYRKDKKLWSNAKEISLGDVGEEEIHARLFRLGIFRSIEFELSATDAVPIVQAVAEADITVLR